MKISGTFIDEISHDIPHQNWGPTEWEADFKIMQSIGIDTVILIRCGYKKWMTYNSSYLQKKESVYHTSTDLVDLFLRLSERYNMDFYFGLYDSGKYWWEQNDFATEAELNFHVIEEVWLRYGHYPAFKGWYLSQELSRKNIKGITLYRKLGKTCKEISDGLPVLISPYIDGKKSVLSSAADISKSTSVSLDMHEKEWDEIFEAIKDSVDYVAFQDGHVDYHELKDYLSVNKNLADKHGLTCWSNIESFDRDMPIKFLPIKWDKLKMKMELAQAAGVEKLITFEFSHFMSPQSSYIQAHHLFNRYTEYFHG